jgi:hypothetical protein
MTAPAEPIRNPFTVLIDTAEGQPWTFHGLTCDADKENLPLYVPTRFQSLGRHPCSLGDYSIAGLTDEVAIERKSMEDIWGTVLGWQSDYQAGRNISGRRARFECELANLAKINAACVVVEASWEDCIGLMPEWGVKPAATNRKIFLRSIISFQQRFKLAWNFMPGRRAAEIFAFRFLERYWKKLSKAERQAALERAGVGAGVGAVEFNQAN